MKPNKNNTNCIVCYNYVTIFLFLISCKKIRVDNLITWDMRANTCVFIMVIIIFSDFETLNIYYMFFFFFKLPKTYHVFSKSTPLINVQLNYVYN